MAAAKPALLPKLQQQLISAAQAWARHQGFDPDQAARLHRAAILVITPPISIPSRPTNG